jgi:hypothetical protein
VAASSMTIVIPSCRGRRPLLALLDSVRRAAEEVERHERAMLDVVVAGTIDGATDQLVEASGNPVDVTIIAVESGSALAARNAGVAGARSELVWLVDDRTAVTAAALERHWYHDRRQGQVLMGPCPLPSGDPRAFDAPWWYEWRDRRLTEQGRVVDGRDCTFSNVSGPTSLLRQFPFDEQFRTERIADVEAGVRLLENGVEFAFDGAAGVRLAELPADCGPALMEDVGADRLRFLHSQPEHYSEVLDPAPGLVERTLRRALQSRVAPVAGRGLRIGGRALTSVVAPRAGRRQAMVRQFAQLASLYAGMAAAATDGEAAAVLRRSMRASLASAVIQRSRLARWWDEEVADRPRAGLLPLRVHHVHGPRPIRRDRRDLLAITTVRNGAFYIPSFLEHHRRLGIRHFLMLDNGSTDGTIELLCDQSDVTLYRTAVPYRTHENLMKRYMVRKHSKGKWNLFVDIDELFDYPASDRLDLLDLLGYLEHHGYTGLVAQMLDMFSAEPLAGTPAATADLRSTFRYFDVSDISRRPYEFDDRPGSKLESHHGGIRRTVFGSENSLTKAPLIFYDGEIETFVSWHHVRNARLADITALLLHYPFNRTFYEKAEEAARSGRYGIGASHEYRAYWSVLADDPNLSLHLPTAQEFVDIDQLVDLGFLLVSRPYQDWVAAHPSASPRRGPAR